MSRSERFLRATAAHEAGHAVIAAVSGFKIRNVSISLQHPKKWDIKASTYSGLALELRRLPTARTTVKALVRVAMSGGAAQRRAYPNSFRKWHVTDDERLVAFHARPLCSTEAEFVAQIALLRAQTVTSVDRHWLAIEALTERLFVKRSVPGAEVMDLVNQVKVVPATDYKALAAQLQEHLPVELQELATESDGSYGTNNGTNCENFDYGTTRIQQTPNDLGSHL